MIFYNGATGGLGRYLGPLLAARGVDHRQLTTRIENSRTLHEELASEPLPESGSVVALIHLAAVVSVPRCEADPDGARLVNADGALEYVRSFVGWCGGCGYLPTVVYVSSGHVYAAPMPRVPVTETAATGPRSVYARTKLQAEYMLSDFAADAGFRLTIARVFGLIAPGQPPNYLLPSLIDRVKSGNVTDIPGLGHVRDYLDARDVARHLHNLTDRAQNENHSGTTIVNVCSGIGVQIGDVLDMVIDTVHGTESPEAARIRAAVTGTRGRTTDATWLVGSPDLLEQLTSKPAQSIDLKTTVRDAITLS